jgi:hypothetical protein
MAERSDAQLGALLARIVNLYAAAPEGGFYVAPPAVQEAKRALADLLPGQRLWRDEIPALIERWRDRPDPAQAAADWLTILMQYHAQIERHTRGPAAPHCGQCKRPFTVSFLPECIVVTRPLAQVLEPGFRIGGMCRDCMSFSEERFPELGAFRPRA